MTTQNIPNTHLFRPINELAERATRYLENAIGSPTLGHFQSRRKVVNRTIEQIHVEIVAIETRMHEGWEFIDRQDDPEKVEQLTDKWLKWLAGYESTLDFVAGVKERLKLEQARLSA